MHAASVAIRGPCYQREAGESEVAGVVNGENTPCVRAIDDRIVCAIYAFNAESPDLEIAVPGVVARRHEDHNEVLSLLQDVGNALKQ